MISGPIKLRFETSNWRLNKEVCLATPSAAWQHLFAAALALFVFCKLFFFVWKTVGPSIYFNIECTRDKLRLLIISYSYYYICMLKAPQKIPSFSLWFCLFWRGETVTVIAAACGRLNERRLTAVARWGKVAGYRVKTTSPARDSKKTAFGKIFFQISVSGGFEQKNGY